MGQSNWLSRAMEYFSHLPRNIPRLDLWRDFLLWAAYQSGEPHQKDEQAEILAHYGGDIRTLFMGGYRAICLGIADDPHQNVPLRLGIAFGAATKYTYDEANAERVFLQQASVQAGKSDFDRVISNIDIITFWEGNCDADSGSALISLANVAKSKFQDDFQEKTLFVAGGAGNGYSHLAAFVQLSIMGMSCYASMDTTATSADKQALFAPPSAICSPEFFSEYWTKLRWREMHRHGLRF